MSKTSSQIRVPAGDEGEPQPRVAAVRSADRRELLRGAGALGLLAGLGPKVMASAVPRALQSAAPPPRYTLSLAQWSLHRMLRGLELTNLEFPGFARERFELDAVEYVNSFFKDKATDFNYLRELRERAADAGVVNLLIMIDGEGSLGDADPVQRRLTIRNHVRWIVAAAYLGCHSIRVNAGGEGSREEVAQRAAESLAILAEHGEPYDISVLVENHGGYSSDGSWLAGVMKAAAHPEVGTLPDFGNFHLGDGKHYDRYKGVAELMPWAKAVSAKSHDFDAEGNEVYTDYRRMLRIVCDAGYNGRVGIEYEGSVLSETEGVILTRDLLLRVRDELDSAPAPR